MKQTRILTRDSFLAMAQTIAVSEFLIERSVEPIVTAKKTHGDIKLDAPLYEIGNPADKEGKAFFTKELEDGLLEKAGDLAVHSLKDLPTQLPDGLTFAAAIMEEERGDTIVATQPLPQGPAEQKALLQKSRLGTSSLRRIALLREWLGNPVINPVRGNIVTRMEKLLAGEEMDFLVLATAGLKRLFDFHRYWISRRDFWLDKLDASIIDKLDEETRRIDALQKGGLHFYRFDETIFLPAVSQGVLGLECREEDRQAVRQAFDPPPELEERIALERTVLSKLEAGCHVPFGLQAQKQAPNIESPGETPSKMGVYQMKFYFARNFDPDSQYTETPYRARRNIDADLSAAQTQQDLELITQEALGVKFPIRFCGKAHAAQGGEANLKAGPATKVRQIFEQGGFEFLHLPLIQTSPLENIGQELNNLKPQYDFCVVTSKSALEYLPDQPSLPQIATWVAVGKKTAQAVESRFGVSAISPQPGSQTGEGAARLIVEAAAQNKTVLWLGATEGRQEGIELLKKAGLQVDAVELYKTNSCSIEAAIELNMQQGLLEDGAAEEANQNEIIKEIIEESAWWLFTSPSSAASYFDQKLHRPNHMLAVIGETTAAEVYRQGRTPIMVSSEASLEVMAREVAAMENYENITLTKWSPAGYPPE